MPRFRCQECWKEFAAEVAGDAYDIRCPNCGSVLRDVAAQRLKEEGETSTWSPKSQVSAGRGDDKYVKVKSGDVLHGFRVEEMIGAGAMAVVYRATQLSLNRPVALKILPKRFSNNPLFVQQFDSETAMLASLNHPNVVSIIDRGREGDTYFFAMEYVEGATLRDMMRSGQISPEFMAKIFRQCGEALRSAHKKGIIHRDIKPANIMLDDQGNVKIADFGIAGIIARGEPEEGLKRRVMGTPGYMSPEQQVDVKLADERSDLFSLGAVMYQTLAGKLPTRLPPEPPSKVNSDADPRLDGLVLKCLKEEPDERFQSADEFLEMMAAYHKELTRVGEVCPACKSENPVTQKACLNCGADLSDLFDLCPDCGTENRRDVDICIGCGANLNVLRQKIDVMITKRRERAATLAAASRYDDAIETLRPILQVKGRIYERTRGQTERAIAKCHEQRRAHFSEMVQHGQALASQGDLQGALDLWQRVPQDAVPGADPAQLAEKARAQMGRCGAAVKKATELLSRRQHQEASALLAKVEAAWPQCPGISEARHQVQAAQQTEEMIDYGIKEADELLAKGQYREARESLRFALVSVPDHPSVLQKIREIDQNEKQSILADLLQRAAELQQAGKNRAAARRWQQAAEMLDDANPRKGELIEKARRASELAGPDEEEEEEEKAETPEAQGQRQAASQGRRVPLRPTAAKKGWSKRKIIGGAVVAGVIIVAAVLAVILLSEHRPGEAVVPPDGPDQGPKQPPKPRIVPPPQEPAPTERYFVETFDDRTAKHWDFPTGGWRLVPSQDRLVLRADAEDGKATAEHKYYSEKDVGVQSWVEMSADRPAPPGLTSYVTLSARRQDDSAVELRLTQAESGILATFRAVVDGNVVQESPPVTVAEAGKTAFDGALRIDAIGGVAAASVSGKMVGVLKNLPSELDVAGKAALEAAFCRASWDDVNLDRPVKANVPSGTGQGTARVLIPVAQVAAAAGVQEVALGEHTLSVAQSFTESAAGWRGVAGEWKLLGPGRYGFDRSGSGTSLFALGKYSDAEIEAHLAAGTLDGDSGGRRFGVLARYEDPANYVFFGAVGLGKDEWAVQLVASKAGSKVVLSAPGGPYDVGKGSVKLRLTVGGGRACGYVDDKAVLSMEDVDSRAPAVGELGLVAEQVPLVCEGASVRVAQTVTPSTPGTGEPGTVPLIVPEGAVVFPVEAPAMIGLRKCGLHYVLLDRLEAGSCTMSVTLRMLSPKRYPSLALCGVAKGEELAFAMMDIDRLGNVRLRLAGAFLGEGGVGKPIYADRNLVLDMGPPHTMTLVLRPDLLEFRIDGAPVAGYQPGPPPLPSGPGMWGFKANDMDAIIERVDLEL